MINGKRVGAIIPAAGSGMRMGGIQKQFLLLHGEPVICHALRAFQDSPLIDCITVATGADAVGSTRELVLEQRFTKVTKVIEGGAHRQDSVWNGIQAMMDDSIDLIVIHDGARPFVSKELIAETVKTAEDFGAAIAGVPANDTIKLTDQDNIVAATLDRDRLWFVQTPQAAKFALLVGAFEKARAEAFYGTDEAILLERNGTKVKVVRGNYDNIKITTPEDMGIAENIARKRLI